MKYYLDSMVSTSINTNHVESSLKDLSEQRDFKKLDSSFSNMHETSFDHMQKYAKSLPPLENAKQQQHLPIIPEANLTGTFD